MPFEQPFYVCRVRLHQKGKIYNDKMLDRAAQTLSAGSHGSEGSVAGEGSQQEQQQQQDLSKVLSERSEQEDGTVQLQPAEYRRLFWQMHMSSNSPFISAVAGQLLSAHVTSCAPEHNWSMFGSIFSKTNNQLTLERAKKIAYIWGISSMGADQVILLSGIDITDGKEKWTAKF